MAPLGFAYVISLAASLIVAITVTPVLSALFLPGSKTVQRNVEPRFIHALKRGYRRMLQATVLRWKTIAAFGALALVASLFALTQAGRAFLPDLTKVL